MALGNQDTPPTVEQMVAMLKARVFESVGRDNNVTETPDEMCIRAAEYLETAKELIECLLENDPLDPISDAGHVVLDLWRHDARTFLDIPTPTKVSVVASGAPVLSESIMRRMAVSVGGTRYKHCAPST